MGESSEAFLAGNRYEERADLDKVLLVYCCIILVRLARGRRYLLAKQAFTARIKIHLGANEQRLFTAYYGRDRCADKDNVSLGAAFFWNMNMRRAEETKHCRDYEPRFQSALKNILHVHQK